jgi:hypothetical protein
MKEKVDIDAIDKAQYKIADIVARDGFYLFYSQGLNGKAPFGYTIGLTHFDSPEFFVSGFSRKRTRGLFTHIVGEFWENGPIATGVPYTKFFIDIKCAFGRVYPADHPDYFRKGINYYGGSKFEVLQCVWPNAVYEGSWVFRSPQDILIRQFP